jgi:hypothetical protein
MLRNVAHTRGRKVAFSVYHTPEGSSSGESTIFPDEFPPASFISAAKPCSQTHTTAAVREATPNLPNMRLTCFPWADSHSQDCQPPKAVVYWPQNTSQKQ